MAPSMLQSTDGRNYQGQMNGNYQQVPATQQKSATAMGVRSSGTVQGKQQM
jgi:hypothetical protein